MGLNVTFVSGPRGAGKSALIRAMIDHLWEKQPHYLRLAASNSDKRRPKKTTRKIPDCGVATARWLTYDEEHIYEILPNALTAIHHEDRYGSVVVEADADPILRHAYPYDHRIFIMPIPSTISEVFRDPERAAAELRRAMDDTAAFASEIFGMVTSHTQIDSEPSEDRPELTDTMMRGFLYSPLGDELATRIMLQPRYHGMVESDVIVINTGVGLRGPETEICLNRITKLLERLKEPAGRRTELYTCDPHNPDTQSCKELHQALKPMCQPGH